MKKMNLFDAAKHFGISKEAIHNRVRRGSLETVVEDGVKLILVNTQPQTTPRTVKKEVRPDNSKYYQFLEEQNSKLLDKVTLLEDEIRMLHHQKEEILLAECDTIEEIYKEKDAQITKFLEVFQAETAKNKKFFDEQKKADEIPNKEQSSKGITSLKEYAEQNDLTDKKVKKIKEKFKKISNQDDRIIVKDKKYYLDLEKYDYRDLL